jgi:uncharacterized protein with PIN domain
MRWLRRLLGMPESGSSVEVVSRAEPIEYWRGRCENCQASLRAHRRDVLRREWAMDMGYMQCVKCPDCRAVTQVWPEKDWKQWHPEEDD